jgi:hypothetical protein
MFVRQRVVAGRDLVAGAARPGGRLAHRCLEAAHASPALLSTDSDLRAIRDLVLTDEVEAQIKADAEADALLESLLAVEKDRAAAIELGRREGAREWAAAVEDLAQACTMRPGVQRHLELERLAPFVERARKARAE